MSCLVCRVQSDVRQTENSSWHEKKAQPLPTQNYVSTNLRQLSLGSASLFSNPTWISPCEYHGILSHSRGSTRSKSETNLLHPSYQRDLRYKEVKAMPNGIAFLKLLIKVILCLTGRGCCKLSEQSLRHLVCCFWSPINISSVLLLW